MLFVRRAMWSMRWDGSQWRRLGWTLAAVAVCVLVAQRLPRVGEARAVVEHQYVMDVEDAPCDRCACTALGGEAVLVKCKG